MAARCNATRDVWAIVRDGFLDELRQALPSDKTKRKEAFSFFYIILIPFPFFIILI